jgi:hypothetical protein
MAHLLTAYNNHASILPLFQTGQILKRDALRDFDHWHFGASLPAKPHGPDPTHEGVAAFSARTHHEDAGTNKQRKAISSSVLLGAIFGAKDGRRANPNRPKFASLHTPTTWQKKRKRSGASHSLRLSTSP